MDYEKLIAGSQKPSNASLGNVCGHAYHRLRDECTRLSTDSDRHGRIQPDSSAIWVAGRRGFFEKHGIEAEAIFVGAAQPAASMHRLPPKRRGLRRV
jgi:hypothetical protein